MANLLNDIIGYNIKTIQYASKDLMIDYNGNHMGSVQEDLETIKNAVSAIYNQIKQDNVNPGKVDTNKTGESVAEWYANQYPDDADIMYDSNDVTFRDIIYDMVNGKDFYDIIGVGDSIVRERIFERIANIYNISYDDIYNLWLGDYAEISKDAKEKFGA